MGKDKQKSNQDEFEIVDFDLNEYDEEFEKEEEKLRLKEEKRQRKADAQQAKAAKTKEVKKKSSSDDSIINKPNRDMLKTILMILFVIVIACLFLGFITLVVNSVSGESLFKKKEKATTQEQNIIDQDVYPEDNNVENNNLFEEQKEKLEDAIDDITNKVNQDLQATTEAVVEDFPEEVITEEPSGIIEDIDIPEEPIEDNLNNDEEINDVPVEPAPEENIPALPEE